MGYTDLPDLDCARAITLGGIDNKTGKKNPTSIEGYYLGSREVVSKKSKTGFSKIHVFQTPKENVGVWGKTDLDRQLPRVKLGTMTLVKFVGMKPTDNNPMYKYKISVDKTNNIEVEDPAPQEAVSYQEETEDSGYEDTETEAFSDDEPEEAAEDEAPVDEARPVQVTRKAQAEPKVNPKANKSNVETLLGKRKVA